MQLDELLVHDRWLVCVISLFGEDFVNAALCILDLGFRQRAKFQPRKTRLSFHTPTLPDKNCSLYPAGTVAVFATSEGPIHILPYARFCTCAGFSECLFCIHILAALLAICRFGSMQEPAHSCDIATLANILFPPDCS